MIVQWYCTWLSKLDDWYMILDIQQRVFIANYKLHHQKLKLIWGWLWASVVSFPSAGTFLMITGDCVLDTWNNVICTHLGAGTHGGIQYHAPYDDPDSFIILMIILLCCLAWFYASKSFICLTISADRLLEWFMVLNLFAQITYVC